MNGNNMISETFEKVRSNKPLVHHITNWVTIYDCANMTRAFGALPVMAHAKEESGDMAAIASSLVLNIGTLTPELIDSMIIAGKSANKKGIPVVLDAVGVGATKLRDNEALRLLKEIRIDIIKGNSSEIAKLAGMNVTTRGVESTKVDANLVDVAGNLANKYNSTVVITGKQDIATDGKKVYLPLITTLNQKIFGCPDAGVDIHIELRVPCQRKKQLLDVHVVDDHAIGFRLDRRSRFWQHHRDLHGCRNGAGRSRAVHLDMAG